MAGQRQFYTNIDLNGNEIKDVLIDVLAADPGAPAAGQLWMNTTDNCMRYFDGTNTIDIKAAAVDGGAFLGTHDASGGGLPSATGVIAGDKYLVSVGGTIAGLGTVEPGDMIFALTDAPASASDWTVVQGNLTLPASGVATCERQTVALVANTGLTVTAANMTSIESLEVYDSSGERIEVCIEDGAGADEKVLTSNQALTGVSVRMMGC